MKFIQTPIPELAIGENLQRKVINGRRFYMVEGKPLPSVTTVLGAKPKPELEAWRNRVGHDEAAKITQQAAHRGSGTHALCEAYLQNQEIDYSQHNPLHIDLFQSIKPVLDRSITDVYAIEQQMYSLALGVAGTADLMAKFDGVNSIIDFKTSLKTKREEWITDYYLQGAAYAMMAYELSGIMFPQIVIIIAIEGTDQVQVFKKRSAPLLAEWAPKIEYFSNLIISEMENAK